MHGIFTYTCNQDHLNVVSVWVSHRGEGPFGPNPSEVKVLGTVDGKDRGGKTPESGKQNTGNLVFRRGNSGISIQVQTNADKIALDVF